MAIQIGTPSILILYQYYTEYCASQNLALNPGLPRRARLQHSVAAVVAVPNRIPR
jgi:hypothetical protein